MDDRYTGPGQLSTETARRTVRSSLLFPAEQTSQTFRVICLRSIVCRTSYAVAWVVAVLCLLIRRTCAESLEFGSSFVERHEISVCSRTVMLAPSIGKATV